MTFWSGEKLFARLPLLVSDYTEHRIDCAAYTLRMGKQYYLSAPESGAATNKLRQLADGESLTIPSGQFAILLTEETVTVPAGVIAFISMKTSLKGRGLVNVSGFHVDPGYSAPLRFSVFNAGPSPILIRRGEDCFLIWYADLDHEDVKYIKKESQNREYAKGISSRDISSLIGPVTTISVLAEKIEQLSNTQYWMKWFIGVLSFVGAIVISMMIFFAQEGIKSFLKPDSATPSSTDSTSTTQTAPGITPQQSPATNP